MINPNGLQEWGPALIVVALVLCFLIVVVFT